MRILITHYPIVTLRKAFLTPENKVMVGAAPSLVSGNATVVHCLVQVLSDEFNASILPHVLDSPGVIFTKGLSQSLGLR